MTELAGPSCAADRAELSLPSSSEYKPGGVLAACNSVFLNPNRDLGRPLNVLIIGATAGEAFIGPLAHIPGIRATGANFLGGMFSRNHVNNDYSARFFGAARVYASVEELIGREVALRGTTGQAADYVVIATPNSSHVPIAMALAEAGIDFLVEKPLGVSESEAWELRELVRQKGLVGGLAHTYAMYPMIAEAISLCRSGALGKIHTADFQYEQGWLHSPIERDGQRQALVRTDPKISGPGGSVSDIGSHIFDLATRMLGCEPAMIKASLRTLVEGRQVDDSAIIQLCFANDAEVLLRTSQTHTMGGNSIRFVVSGDNGGGIEWSMDQPDHLWVRIPGVASGRKVRYEMGHSDNSPLARGLTTGPGEHRFGNRDAFANLHMVMADRIVRNHLGKPISMDTEHVLPNMNNGYLETRMIDRAVKSNNGNGVSICF